MSAGLLMLAGGCAAGVFGSLLGLGGGILIVPLLTLAFDLPLREAVGISLVCVIVTSSASAAVYLQRDVANLRLGMTLELFTALGALAGGLVAFLLPDRMLAALFAALLVYVGLSMARRREGPAVAAVTAAVDPPEEAQPAARRPFLEALSGPGYRVRHIGRGIGGSVLAGVVSALFGVGGGIVKVPVMHLLMGVPMRVATATSNLMIGITASTSAIVYLLRGGIDPYVAAPTAVGVFVGATVGSLRAHRVDTRLLRWVFIVVLAYTAVEMILRALG